MAYCFSEVSVALASPPCCAGSHSALIPLRSHRLPLSARLPLRTTVKPSPMIRVTKRRPSHVAEILRAEPSARRGRRSPVCPLTVAEFTGGEWGEARKEPRSGEATRTGNEESLPSSVVLVTEPPDADPHIRWRGRVKPPGSPLPIATVAEWTDRDYRAEPTTSSEFVFRPLRRPIAATLASIRFNWAPRSAVAFTSVCRSARVCCSSRVSIIISLRKRRP